MGPSFYRNSECCALVCDLTDEKSFESVENWRVEFLNQLNPKDPDNYPFVLLGNKCDKKEEKKVQEIKIKKYCELKNILKLVQKVVKMLKVLLKKWGDWLLKEILKKKILYFILRELY